MNKYISTTTHQPRYILFIAPILLLCAIALLLYHWDALSVKGYIYIQKEWFYFINAYLKEHPQMIFNLTQIGDAMIFLSFLTFLLRYAPKIWESIITALLISMLLTLSLKESFSIPRPAKIFDYKTFTIIGEKLIGSTSCPSGHSITIFTILTVLLFTLVPKNASYRLPYFICAISMGLLFAFTRVAVGAHYPLDVIIGCILGYLSGLLGVCITQKYTLWPWIHQKRYYPLLLLLLLCCSIALIVRILQDNLFIYYCALVSVTYSSYKIAKVYVQK
ncbi:phosphatase PAP2 family protein [Myroides sp. DF42-4-2]|uniref:phosphatase PAP2 family protein n=1 Tax=unclassified Myroides TaxID=2642485 RepID=UPI0025781B29|nr:phosphatase PAP2 family protein [Myroides sp. DF42-4-2]MDM1408829.1 phosphatase PAP2 family protein [Myroides sp. DF42-4-2]